MQARYGDQSVCLFSDDVVERCETIALLVTWSSLSDRRLPSCINEAMMDWFHGSAGAEFILVDGARLNQQSHVSHSGQMIDGIAYSMPSV